jgi:Hypoxia induced protein conserved region
MTTKLIVAVAVGLVAFVLMAGLYTLWAGGDVARTWSNRLMRIRVLAQFVAILIIMTAVYLARRH